MTPTSPQQPQPQDPTPKRDSRIMRRTIAQVWEARETIGEGGREVKKRKRSQKRYRRHVENGEHLGGRRNQRRQESIGSVDVGSEDLKNSNEAGKEAQGAQGFSKNCTNRESVSPVKRLIRGFHTKYQYYSSPFGRNNASDIE